MNLEMWHINKMEYCSDMKKTEVLSLATTRMNLQDITLGEIDQAQKD